MRIEQLDQLGEVGERPRQPVDLVDDDHVDPPRPNVIEQLLERRPVHRPARKAAVVVAVPYQSPAFMSLALDIGFRCFPLVVERVELLLQSVLGGDASVDRAAEARLAALGLHGAAASWSTASLRCTASKGSGSSTLRSCRASFAATPMCRLS